MIKNQVGDFTLPLSDKSILFFQKKSFFVFTSDIDWAPEWAIRKTLDIFKSFDIPLTPFITHESEVIKREYANVEKSRYVGLHPNFLPNSRLFDVGNKIVDMNN